jgi:biotin carboxyl carrier protein
MPVESPVKGKVDQIAVAEGQAVDEGAVLLTIA